jgi:antitoxin (DNA-binding transcriptional repressor) of toxin-antitoxin stability system
METHIINIKELRASMPEVVNKVKKGDQYMVFYRSKPAFRIVAVDAKDKVTLPLKDDPIYQAPAVGQSTDGLSAQDHDLSLYGTDPL